MKYRYKGEALDEKTNKNSTTEYNLSSRLSSGRSKVV